jgi:hypothetical protein
MCHAKKSLYLKQYINMQKNINIILDTYVITIIENTKFS